MSPGGPELARQTLGAVRRQSGRGLGRAGGVSSGAPAPPRQSTGATTVRSTAAVTSESPGGAALRTLPSRDELVQVWGDGLLSSLPNRARARFRVGRFLDVDASAVVFALPNETHRSYCEEVRPEVEAALGDHFGTAVPIRLVVDDEAEDETTSPDAAARRVASRPAAGETRSIQRPPNTEPDVPADEEPDLLDPEVLAAETEPAGAGLTPEERLIQAFPGAQEV
jgi:DNA polymerase III subunit gamma/tau